MSAEQRLDRFKQSVLKELEIQQEQMTARMEEERKAAFIKAEDEVLAQCYTYIKGETARLQTEAHRKISEQTLEMKKNVLRRRTALCDELFLELKGKIIQFLQTEAYGKYLSNCLNEIRKEVPDDGQLEISIGEEDAKRLSLEGMIVINKQFPLGGFTLTAKETGKYFDARLDTKLLQLRQEFINMFDISV